MKLEKLKLEKKKLSKKNSGKVSRIAGSFVTAKGMKGARMFELVKVGEAGVIG